MNQIFNSIKGNIKNDPGVKVAGCVLMVAALAAVFVPGQQTTFVQAAPFFLIGLYLAFRKEKTKQNG